MVRNLAMDTAEILQFVAGCLQTRTQTGMSRYGAAGEFVVHNVLEGCERNSSCGRPTRDGSGRNCSHCAMTAFTVMANRAQLPCEASGVCEFERQFTKPISQVIENKSLPSNQYEYIWTRSRGADAGPCLRAN
jgi:hypothetical protein